MKSSHDVPSNIPEEQLAIRAKSIHPTGTFIPFLTEALDQSLPDIFEKQALQHPDRLAIRTRDHSYTYQELNASANQLAHAIVEKCGIAKENIALVLEHGALQIVTILSVLKAGKVYVPLDLAYPIKRLAYMLEDSQAKLIISNKTNRSLANTLAKNVPVIDIDKDEIPF